MTYVLFTQDRNDPNGLSRNEFGNLKQVKDTGIAGKRDRLPESGSNIAVFAILKFRY